MAKYYSTASSVLLPLLVAKSLGGIGHAIQGQINDYSRRQARRVLEWTLPEDFSFEYIPIPPKRSFVVPVKFVRGRDTLRSTLNNEFQ